MSDAVPVMLDTVLASMVPEVLLSKLLRSEAAIVVSLSVTAGFPKPVMPLEA